MNKIIRFGEDVEGYSIPVLNEREIRAAAGILFLLMFISISIVLSNGDFILLKYAVIIFYTDLLLRVFINPRFSPSMIIGRMIVSNQAPEYVGAVQKKFAWTIGIVIASIMFILLVVINSYSPVTGILCLVCLVFLFFEAAFGICLGCLFYPLFYKKKIKHCPGEVCERTRKEAIQKTTIPQLLTIAGFIAYIFLVAFFFKNDFRKTPHNLFGKPATSISKNKLKRDIP